MYYQPSNECEVPSFFDAMATDGAAIVHFFIVSLAVIPHLVFLEKVRSWHGKHGIAYQKSPLLSWGWDWEESLKKWIHTEPSGKVRSVVCLHLPVGIPRDHPKPIDVGFRS